MAPRKSPLLNTATTLGKVVAFFGAAALAGALVAGLFVPATFLLGAGTSAAAAAFDDIDTNVTNAPWPEPSLVLDRDGNELAKFYLQNRDPVKLENISPHMRKAIVSVEDERFYQHGGVDPRGLARAMVTNMTGGHEGASTLTQQYVNNVNINNQVAQGVNASDLTISGNKTSAYKLREMKMAIQAEKTMSKDQILEGYLNLVLFSGTTYGIEAAAQRFYSIPAKQLDIQQSATLAGMVQRPGTFNPITNPEATTKRRNIVLGQMLKTGAITKAEFDAAVKAPLAVKPSEDKNGCHAAPEAQYFCTYVVNSILNDKTFGATTKDREAMLYRGGLRITTTLDSKMQAEAQKQVEKTVPVGDEGGLGSVLVSRQNSTGQILAMAQNTKLGTKKGDEGYTEINLATSKFQGGSTAKPWTAVAWIEDGHSMGEVVDASRKDYSKTTWKASCLDGGTTSVGEWKVGNSIANMYNRMPASAGLYWSVNSATAAEAYKLDMCKIMDVGQRMGLFNKEYAQKEARNPSSIIGSANVTPLDQARGFSAFGNEGKMCANRYLLSVKAKDKDIKLPEADCQRVFEADTMAKLNGTLKQIASKRVVKGSFDASVAGKTGTNNQGTSTWFAGYTSDVTTVAWVGRKDGRTPAPGNGVKGLNNGIKLKGQRQYSGDSTTYAAPLWTRYMAKVYDLYPHESIPSQGPFSSDRNVGKGAGNTDAPSGESSNRSSFVGNGKSTSSSKSEKKAEKKAADKKAKKKADDAKKKADAKKKDEAKKDEAKKDDKGKKKDKPTTPPSENKGKGNGNGDGDGNDG